MATIQISTILDRSAAMLNDVALSSFTYVVQLPYYNAAQDELNEIMEQNNVPVTNDVSATIVVTTAMTDIGGVTGTALPTDLIELQGVLERQTGTLDDFIPLTRLEFLPQTVIKTTDLEVYSYQEQVIKFIGALTSRDVRLNYIANKLPVIVGPVGTQTISLINAMSYLAYRTAALCAQFVGENKSRADELNGFAGVALDRFLGINTKGRQQINTRRRPFRAAYKARGYI